MVPAEAKIEVDGVKTTQAGTIRLFMTPELEIGKKFFYELKVSYLRDGKEVSLTQSVTVEPSCRQRHPELEGLAGISEIGRSRETQLVAWVVEPARDVVLEPAQQGFHGLRVDPVERPQEGMRQAELDIGEQQILLLAHAFQAKTDFHLQHPRL